MDKTDARLLSELFPDRSLTPQTFVEVNPNRVNQRQSSGSRLRIKPLPKKERLTHDVNQKLGEVVAYFEDKGF